MLRSLFFLLLVLLSTLANVNGNAMHSDSGSDGELYWQQDASSKTMEDDLQKLAK